MGREGTCERVRSISGARPAIGLDGDVHKPRARAVFAAVPTHYYYYAIERIPHACVRACQEHNNPSAVRTRG
jgi:hypothetical protein